MATHPGSLCHTDYIIYAFLKLLNVLNIEKVGKGIMKLIFLKVEHRSCFSHLVKCGASTMGNGFEVTALYSEAL